MNFRAALRRGEGLVALRLHCHLLKAHVLQRAGTLAGTPVLGSRSAPIEA